MSAPCSNFRDAFQDAVPAERSGAHRATCAECARWARAFEAREAALSRLTRFAAPAELDGAVVAALEAGFRQERAVGALGVLGRVAPPRALDHALQGELVSAPGAAALPTPRRLRAPSELAGRVSDELGDPAGHRVRRFVGSLERLQAPAELAERLTAEDWSPRRRSVRVKALGGLALVALAFALSLVLREEPPRSPRYDFVVEVVDDPAQLSGLGTGLLDGLSGGLVSLGRL